LSIIHYRNLADAQSFYHKNGFLYTETPWWVTKPVIDITIPDGVNPDYYLETNDKYLVASGEQSFLYQRLKGVLPGSKYQTITPCFRFEPQDFTHRKHFMKCELIEFLPPTDPPKNAVMKMIALTSKFFGDLIVEQREDDWESVFDHLVTTEVPPMKRRHLTENYTYDINLHGVEIGSYGYRKFHLDDRHVLSWVYGTGIAEPRFSLALHGDNYEP
jgi:hypothetical protein